MMGVVYAPSHSLLRKKLYTLFQGNKCTFGLQSFFVHYMQYTTCPQDHHTLEKPGVETKYVGYLVLTRDTDVATRALRREWKGDAIGPLLRRGKARNLQAVNFLHNPAHRCTNLRSRLLDHCIPRGHSVPQPYAIDQPHGGGSGTPRCASETSADNTIHGLRSYRLTGVACCIETASSNIPTTNAFGRNLHVSNGWLNAIA